MKRLVIPMTLCLAACQQTKTASPADSTRARVPDSITFTPPVVQQAGIPSDTVFMTGDFNGDGNIDTAYATLLKPPAGEDEQAQYKIRFLSNTLPGMPDISGRARLINEGDLDGDGADELSTFNEPLHGCTYDLTTWTFASGEWKQFAAPQLVPTACEVFTDEQLQQRIVLENDTVFVWAEDLNDENFKLVKKPLVRQ